MNCDTNQLLHDYSQVSSLNPFSISHIKTPPKAGSKDDFLGGQSVGYNFQYNENYIKLEI